MRTKLAKVNYHNIAGRYIVVLNSGFLYLSFEFMPESGWNSNIPKLNNEMQIF